MSIRNNTQGAIALTAVLVLGAVIATMALTMTLSGLSGRNALSNQLKSYQLQIETDGCAEEALIQLKRNSDYAGGTYLIGNASCNVSIDGEDDTRSVSITSLENNFYKSYTLNIQLNPSFAILGFDQ